MSLFERIQNKRYNLQEAPIDDKGNITPEPGEVKKSEKILKKFNKKQKKIEQKNIRKNTQQGDKLLKDINKRKSADLTRADAINRSMGTSGSTEGAGGANTGTPPLKSPKVTGGKARTSDTRSSFPQMNLDGTFDEPKKGRKKRSDAGQKRGRSRRRYFADPNTKQLQLDLTKKADRKQVQQDVAKVVSQPKKTAGAVLQRVFLTKDKGVRGLLANIRKEPVTTAVVAGVARDSFRNPLPQLQMPTVKGGKVGKRTAG